MTTATTPRMHVLPRWFPTPLVQDHTVLALFLWAGVVVFFFLGTFAASFWYDITTSTWDHMAPYIRFYAVAIGAQIGWAAMPLYITHGYTRREFMRQGMMFLPIFVTVLALLTAAGFVLEAGLFRIAGWPQEIVHEQLYDHALDLPAILLQSWLIYGLWAVGGFFISVAWYRNDGLGFLALLLAIVIAGAAAFVMSAGSDIGPQPFGFISRFFVNRFSTEEVGIDRTLAVLTHVACIALMLALSWAAIRNVSIRGKSA